jgi:hypothetical protein
MERPIPAKGTTQEALEDLHITVLFTDLERTRVALSTGLKLAQDLHASFQIVVTRVVPYPLPLDKPPVDSAFIQQQVTALTEGFPIVAVHIYDCRDPETALLRYLPPKSIVIVGSRKAWWSTREEKLARKLRNAGHSVILTGTE